MFGNNDAGALRATFRDVHAHRRLVGLSYPSLALLGFLSALAGLGQAALLILVVRAATALTAQTEQFSGTIGPLTANELETSDLLWLGFGLLLGLLIVEIAASKCQARLYANAHRRTQHHVLTAYSNATFAAQSATDRGDTQQLLHVHAGQVAALINAIGNGVSASANFFVLVLAALVLSPVAAIAVLLGLAVMLLALRPLLIQSKRHADARATSQRTMASLLSERLELNREVRSFGAEDFADAPIRTQIDTVANTFARLRFISRMNSVSYRLGAFGLILAMLALIEATESTSLAALTGALLMLLRSLSYGQATQGAIQSASEALPVFGQLISETERLDGAARQCGNELTPSHLGTLTLDAVSFAYDDAGAQPINGEAPPALRNVDLTFDRGSFVALVGPSGSGKSTLISLLLGIHRPTSGTIRLDGVDLAEVDESWWHQRVAFVPQEPNLQSGSVLEAIRFGRTHISDDAIFRAAARAQIASEIEAWPNGWATEVGTLGDQLSGGQRQRIAIARAIAGDPELLLLDEPTSALDETTESLIAHTIQSLRGETTIVAIAHRPRTIAHADRVVMVRGGRVDRSERQTISLDNSTAVVLDPLPKVGNSR